MQISAIISIIFCLVVFFGYTVLTKLHSQEIKDEYISFKGEYKGRANVVYSVYQENIFSKSHQVLLAVDENRQVVDAKIKEGTAFDQKEVDTTPYLGMNVDVFADEHKITYKGNYYNNQKKKMNGREKAMMQAIRQLRKL